MNYELTAALIPHPPVLRWAGGDKTEDLRKKNKVGSGRSCS